MDQELLHHFHASHSFMMKNSSDDEISSSYNINNKLMGSNHQITNLFHEFFSILEAEKEKKNLFIGLK